MIQYHTRHNRSEVQSKMEREHRNPRPAFNYSDQGCSKGKSRKEKIVNLVSDMIVYNIQLFSSGILNFAETLLHNVVRIHC